MTAWLAARDNAGLCILVALLIASVVAPLIRDAFRAVGEWADRNCDHMVSVALDPVDTHFYSLPDLAPTFADLRAPWDRWEAELGPLNEVDETWNGDVA